MTDSTSSATQQRSLYERLGGYDAIAAVSDDFLGRLVAERRLKRFFVRHTAEWLKQMHQHIIDFLCQATGGPGAYRGRDMKTAHRDLGVTHDDWDAMLNELNATFNKFEVPQKERGEVVMALSGLKADIVVT